MEREATEETDGAVATAATTLGALGVAEPREGDETDLVVPFKIDLDGEICVRMVQALVKYLLYLRGQIPCVYDEFHALVRRQQAEEEEARAGGTRKRKLVSGSVKKARKLVDQANETLEHCLPVMFQQRVRTVALVFGSSLASPRELWRIDFDRASRPSGPVTSTDSTGIKGKEGATLSRDRVLQLCVQKIIRSVLSYASQHFSSSVAVTSLHLLVLAEKADLPVRGFIPKQHLRLRLPKPRRQGKRTHVIQITHGAKTQQATDGDDEFVWYQATRPLVGVARLS